MARAPLTRMALAALARLWMRSWRLRFVPGSALPDRGVLVLWHEYLPACIPAFAHRGIGVLISRSADGDAAAAACAGLGYRVFRGSSSRGSLAGLKALARHLETPSALAGMALDGPRGPRRRPKPGSLWLAGHADAPLHPIAVRARWAFRLGGWDRALVPLPFSRVEFLVGPALRAEDEADVARAMAGTEARLAGGTASRPPARSALAAGAGADRASRTP